MVTNTHHILVDEVEDHICKTRVTPVTMNKQQLAEVFKPGDGKVTGHHSLWGGVKHRRGYGSLTTHIECYLLERENKMVLATIKSHTDCT